MKKKSLVLCALLALLPAAAQPLPPELPPPRRERPPRSEEGIRRAPLRGAEALPPRNHEQGPALDRYLKILQEKNQEEFERLKQLRQEDPEAFRRALRSKVLEARARAGSPEGFRRPHPLAAELQTLHSAKNPEERAAATQALRARIEQIVDQRLEMRERRILEVREELERLEAQHRQDVEARSALIENHLQSLLAMPTPAPAP